MNLHVAASRQSAAILKNSTQQRSPGAPRRRWLLLALVLLSSMTFAAERRPDIVIFLTDDQGQLDSTPYGARALRTPNMQALAESGMTFTRAYVASPSCAPSRAALLTGLMPARNGAEANHSKPRREIRKWPAYFQELGYEVVAFGKVSHYQHTVAYGFDSFAHDTFHDHAAIPAAVQFLKERDRAKAKPLCLFVGSNWPHVPWPTNAPGYDPARLSLPAGSIDTPATREFRARYAAAVTKADDQLGLIRAAVRETLGKDAIFVFTSDHGAQWPFGKWNCYESGVATPLMVSWPGTVKPGSRSDAMVQWIDLLPTMIDLAGGTTPTNIDGRSFADVLRGQSTAHREAIFTTHSGDGRMNVYPVRAVRRGDWKYILNLHPEFAHTTHIDLGAGAGDGWRYFREWTWAAETNAAAAGIVRRYHERPREELYDLRNDPHEQRNFATDPQHAARLAEMRTQLADWRKSQGDQRTVFNKPRPLSDPASYAPVTNPPPTKPAAARMNQ
jgi:arylsulfatase A-like enzyme